MDQSSIIVTIVASLLSGVIGVAVSFVFYTRLERKKLKIDTARKMFGNRYDISGTGFKEALNETMIVFSDSQDVIDNIETFFKVVETPKASRPIDAADQAMIKLMKAICNDLNIKYKNLPESYFLKFFNVPR